MGRSKSSSKREVYNNTILHRKQESQINNLNLHLKQLEEKNKQNPKLVKGKKS